MDDQKSTTDAVRSTSLEAALRAGDERALARALTLVETGRGDADRLLSTIRGDVGKALIVGVTGPPGAGKSTLVDAMITAWRAEGKRVAVLAVDPVSPKSGGAVLGDRTRMGAHSMDAGVFIRSVCSRGHLGGLSAATSDMADVLDVARWPLIVIEAVGAGQSEVDIAAIADISVVVSAPGLGDDLQAIKAGILEIADVLVVNKADRDDAAITAKQLEKMLLLRATEDRAVPVLKVSATTGMGIDDLCEALAQKMAAPSANRAQRRDQFRRAVWAQKLAQEIGSRLTQADLPNPGSVQWGLLVDHIIGSIENSTTGRD